MIQSLLNKTIRPLQGTGIGNNRPVRFLYGLFQRIMADQVIWVNGYKLTGMGQIKFLRWEPYTTELMKRFVKSGMTAVDVGANIGYYTLLLSMLVGLGGTVFAVEPGRKARRILMHNWNINKVFCCNTNISGAAASSEDGTTDLYVGDNMMGSSSLYNQWNEQKPVRCVTQKLDSIVGGNPVDFVKIDTEGAEIEVLGGMTKILKSRPTMIIEFSPRCLITARHNPSDLLSLLWAYDYRLWAISEKGKRLWYINPSYNLGMWDGNTATVNILCRRANAQSQ